MNRAKFIKDLEEYLFDYEIHRDIVDDILSDHEAIIDEAIENGITEDEILNRLGSPKTIAKSLRGERLKSQDKHMITALSPFAALIVFLGVGFGFGIWNPTWLVFMIVPIVAIFQKRKTMRFMAFLTAVSPLVLTTLYLGYGLLYGVWHPTWLILLLIPIFGITTGKSSMTWTEFLVALSPIVIVGFYLGYGFTHNVWHPTWLAFWIIPILGLLTDKDNPKSWIFLVAILCSVVVYFYMDLNDISKYSWLVLVAPLIIGYFTGYVSIGLPLKKEGAKLRDKVMAYLSIGTIVVYLLIGLLFNWWHPGWLIFLVIPVVSIILYNDENE